MGEKDRRCGTDMNLSDDRTAGDGGDMPSGLPQELQGAIGRQLKQVYGQMLSEPLPDKFTQLLDTLSKSGKGE